MRLKNTNKILKSPIFLNELNRIDRLEEDREFCRHGLSHLFDVARIALITCMKEGLDISEDLLYTAALLHDIGRGEEYESGTPHHIAGKKIGAKILESIGAESEFSKNVLRLISSHRGSNSQTELERIFYYADKKSRNCFACSAYNKCNWNESKKNNLAEV